MINIRIGGAIPPVQNNQKKRDNNQKKRDHSRRQAPKKKVATDRRKAKTDRRKTARSGVVVTLSKYPDRRCSADRRKRLA